MVHNINSRYSITFDDVLLSPDYSEIKLIILRMNPIGKIKKIYLNMLMVIKYSKTPESILSKIFSTKKI